MSFRKEDEEEGVAADLQSDEHMALKLLTDRENKAVNYSRIVVVAILAISTVVFSTAAYKLTVADETDTFETTFKSYAKDLIGIFQKSFDQQVLEDFESLAITLTSHALGTNQSFPFVTVPNYHISAGNTRVVSGAMTLNFSPLVSDDEMDEWNKFALDHRSDYIDAIKAEAEQIEVQNRFFEEKDSRRLSISEEDLPPRIMNLDVTIGASVPAIAGTGPYLVTWLQSPAVPFAGGFNFNLFSHPVGRDAYYKTIETGKAVLDRAENLGRDGLGATGDYVKLLLSRSQYRDTVESYANDPSSTLTYPVFDSFDTKTRRVVGTIGSAIYWRLYFSDILPTTAKGIVCVLKNNFNQTFSYKVDGRSAVYLGDGDRHDPKYDHLEQSTDLSNQVTKIASKRTTSYTHVELDNSFAQYSLSVYPSDETMTPFTSSDPAINTMVIVGVFVFVSLVFFAYDAFVRRQKRKLTARAVASGAIVSSLFPSNVRDKLYENEQEKEAAKKKGWLDYSAMQRDDVRQDDSIAELFDSTTIMFADLAGFTKWSSKRAPDKVFLLLETLYQAFDEIAIRRKVFKVETIGDCYVAVAGLPEPQEKNAVIMAKFANECMEKMRELVAALALTLGPDTAELDLRVGLHSGPVTGGVLRGQRSRFQLFGPTMNQASRMESTGVPGRIHVSEETAAELKKHGKTSWLKNRLDKVVAKGLGSIETFWVVVTTEAASTVPTSESRSEI